MKTFLKTFACAVAASIVLLACNDFGTNSDFNSNSDPASCSQLRRIYISYDVYDGPYDPALVIIVGDVKDWMEEQLASGGKERKLVYISISDLPLINNPIEEPVVSGSYNSTTGESKFFVNGQEMTYDEYKEFTEDWRQEYIKLIEERISSYMSSIHIPGEEVERLHIGWKALITAEEIVELAENNEGLAISFYAEPTYMPGGIEPPYMLGDELGGSGDLWTMDGSSGNSPRCP